LRPDFAPNSITPVKEILPGILHWTAFHEGIGFDVSSYYVEPAATLIDPMLPPGGVAALGERRPPERIVLTCRHHFRHSDRFADALGIPVYCNAGGLHEFEGGPAVEGFRPGDTLAPGIVAVEVDVLSPDETALHVDLAGGALAIADGLVHLGEGRLDFVPDRYMGDDPEGVKRGLRAAFKRLAAELEFDALLLAHGDPIAAGGRAALARFLEK
jgi:hypothetical protein